MKKSIILLLVGCIILSCVYIPISAATPIDAGMCRWINTSSVTGRMTFNGTSGNYSMVIEGINGVTQITATARLYYKHTNGNWIEIPKSWSYSVSENYLAIDEDFTGIIGREYKVELSATVYKDGTGESISKTTTGICS